MPLTKIATDLGSGERAPSTEKHQSGDFWRRCWLHPTELRGSSHWMELVRMGPPFISHLDLAHLEGGRNIPILRGRNTITMHLTFQSWEPILQEGSPKVQSFCSGLAGESAARTSTSAWPPSGGSFLGDDKPLQGGPLLVINGLITRISRVITPVTDLTNHL